MLNQFLSINQSPSEYMSFRVGGQLFWGGAYHFFCPKGVLIWGRCFVQVNNGLILLVGDASTRGVQLSFLSDPLKRELNYRCYLGNHEPGRTTIPLWEIHQPGGCNYHFFHRPMP